MRIGTQSTSEPTPFDTHRYWRDLVEGVNPDDVDEVGHPDMGKSWNAWAYRLRRDAVEQAIRRLRPWSEVHRLFEGAFGVGFYLKLWESLRIPSVAGVDLSERAASHCQARFPAFDLRALSLDQIDQLDDWDLLRRSFDVVTAIDIIYHIIDDAQAERAVRSLAELIRAAGLFVVTEKASGLTIRFDECSFVVRRPFTWYESILADCGLSYITSRPIFWCMDPPVQHDRTSPSYALARLAWWAMRAATKPWPRNSSPQRICGSIAGAVGYTVDRMVLRFADSTPNLALHVFRRD